MIWLVGMVWFFVVRRLWPRIHAHKNHLSRSEEIIPSVFEQLSLQFFFAQSIFIRQTCFALLIAKWVGLIQLCRSVWYEFTESLNVKCSSLYPTILWCFLTLPFFNYPSVCQQKTWCMYLFGNRLRTMIKRQSKMSSVKNAETQLSGFVFSLVLLYHPTGCTGRRI